MKTIGLLGGMSWESTLSYYTHLNQGVKQRLGGLHSAKICLYSLDFAEIAELQNKGDWAKTADILSDAAKNIESAGADLLLICTNTMHIVADDIQSNISIPLLNIADACAQELVKDKVKKVGLLGTKFTMEQGFYKGRIKDKYAIDVLVPSAAEQTIVHNVIYQELCLGKINKDSKNKYLAIIENLRAQGAQGIILGCTEIGLLVSQSDTAITLYDTSRIHASAALELALA